MKLAAGVLRWVADWVDPPPPRSHAAVYAGPQASAFDDPDLDARRREDAMKLVDPDTRGYLIVRCRAITVTFSKLEVTTAMVPGMWPPMRDVLQRIQEESERVRA